MTGRLGGVFAGVGGRDGRRDGPRTPFVVAVVALLGGGLLGLLLLNTALNQGSFEQTKLQKEQKTLTDQEQALRRELDALAAPASLAARAQDMGMVPATGFGFVDPRTGQVIGSAKPASALPKPTPTATATAAPAATPGAPVPGAATTPPAPTTTP